MKKALVILLLLAGSALGQGTRIQDLNSVTASGVDDPTEVFFGIHHSGVPGSFKLPLSELQKISVASVRSFGALGDGATDDTTAVAAALTWAQSTGNRLVIPDGTYKLATWTQVALTSSVRIEGINNPTIVGPDTNTGFLRMDEGTSVRISGVTFSMWREPVFIRTNPNFDHETCEITGCTFDGCGQAVDDDGIAALGTLKRFVFTYNTIKDCTEGVFCRASALGFVDISHNEIDGLSSTTTCHGILVSGNSIVSDNEHISICHNKIRNVISSGNSQETHGIIAYGPRIKVIGNTLANINNGNGTADEGLYLKSKYAVIVGNTLENAGQGEAMIAVKGLDDFDDATSAPFGSHVIVSNNNLTETGGGAVAGIMVSNTGCLVQGNHLEGFRRGIYLAETYDTTVDANIIMNGTNGTLEAIRIQNGNTFQITRNKIRNCYNMGIFFRILNTARNFTADASADTVTTSTDNTFRVHDKVTLNTTGTLPDPLTTATEYWIVSVNGDDMELSASAGGTPIDLTDAGSGTHTMALVNSGYLVSGNQISNIMNNTTNVGIEFDPDPVIQEVHISDNIISDVVNGIRFRDVGNYDGVTVYDNRFKNVTNAINGTPTTNYATLNNTDL